MRKDENFLDSKTLMAVLFVFLIYFFWQDHMKKKYPNLGKTPEVQVKKEKAQTQEVNTEVKINKALFQRLKKEKVLKYENKNFSFQLSSFGMGIKNFKLSSFTDRKNKKIVFSENGLNFSSSLEGLEENLFFRIKKESEHSFRGVSLYRNLKVYKKIKVLPEKYALEFSLDLKGSFLKTEAYKGISFLMHQDIKDKKSSFFFLPNWEQDEVFVSFEKGQERIMVSEDPFSHKFSQASLFSLNLPYFSQAFFNQSSFLPNVEVENTNKSLKAKITYSNLNQGQDQISLKYKVFLGPKKISLLKKIDPQADLIVDFGWFSSLGKKIFDLLNFIFKWVPNWGWAIIFLTFLVRLLLLPFNIFSYRSMQKMQKIQPLIQQIKEQYKEDAVKKNQAIMDLMKKEKASPFLGGCLPMFLQLPIFFALYQVLGRSVELYKAPFVFWIQDLSAKDPYYVLPVLVGGSMFVQQKISPTNLDPAQARILHMLPIIFTFFMLTLPSGLNLYIFVSTLFGLIQQWIFLSKTKETT